MPVYAKVVSLSAPVFKDRKIIVSSWSDKGSEVMTIPVANSVVLCNGCNRNMCPEPGEDAAPLYMVYLGKRELAQNRPYNCYCESCLGRYFPKAIKV